jgi:hypothetical protein
MEISSHVRGNGRKQKRGRPAAAAGATASKVSVALTIDPPLRVQFDPTNRMDGSSNATTVWDQNDIRSDQCNNGVAVSHRATAATTTTTVVPPLNKIDLKAASANSRLQLAKANLQKAVLVKKIQVLERKKSIVQTLHMQRETITTSQHIESGPLRPITALLKGGLNSLYITGLKNSGPADKVYFPVTASPKLSQETRSVTCSSEEEDDDNDCNDTPNDNDNVKVSADPIHPAIISQAKNALECRLELMEKLIEAKKMVSQQQKESILCTEKAVASRMVTVAASDSMNDGGQFSDAEEDDFLGVVIQEPKQPSNVPSIAKPTRAELLIRKKEAERHRAITHVKHILSKQQRLVMDQAVEVQKTTLNMQNCTKELELAKTKLLQVQESVQTTTNTQIVVMDEILAEKVSELVKKRKLLHQYNTNDEMEVIF